MNIEEKIEIFKKELISLLSETEEICGIGQTGDI